MRRLEAQFGKTHPELDGFRPLSPRLQWLQTAFFRLHRRRHVTEVGMQPLSFQEITHFADRVLNLPESLTRLFVRAMEEADLAVLHDHYQSRRK